MSECGASLAELRHTQSITEKPHARGTRFSKRCDCKNSNGLDSLCKCTKPPPSHQERKVRVLASPPPPPPPTPRASRRIYTQTRPLVYKSSAPRMGLNLNGDSIPIPSRYKNRKFPAGEDDCLHWMHRPDTPPKPAHKTYSPSQIEEVPHHRRGPMMPCKEPSARLNAVAETTDSSRPAPQKESSTRLNAVAETTDSSRPASQMENAANFHGPETKGGSFQAESSVSLNVSPVNPSQEASCMYKMNRGYDYDQILRTSHRQAEEQISAHLPDQDHIPVSHPVQETVSTSHPVQETIPMTHHLQQPVPSHAVQEAIHASNRAHESISATASIPTPTPIAHREPTQTAVLERPPTPIASQSSFVQAIDAARIQESVAQPKTSCPPTWVPLETIHSPMMAERDLPPCPDQFYPCSHC